MARTTGMASATTQRLPPGEQALPHTQARTERRRNVEEKGSAGRAAAVLGDRTSDIGAQPAAAGLAQRVDALHRQAGQVLHRFTSKAAKRSPSCSARACGRRPGTAREQRICWRAFCPEPSLASREKHHKILW